MATINVNVKLCRACRLLSGQWKVARRLSSWNGGGEEPHVGVSESISRQILQTGFNYLKQGDLDYLKENAANRAVSVDFDKLVHNTTH